MSAKILTKLQTPVSVRLPVVIYHGSYYLNYKHKQLSEHTNNILTLVRRLHFEFKEFISKKSVFANYTVLEPPGI